MPTIIVAVREVFGRLRAYPVNEPARVFTELVGAKTLTGEHLKMIRSLGFTVEYQAQTLEP